MKKYFLSGLTVVFLLVMFVSCEKTNTCECVVSASIMGYTQSQTVTNEYVGNCSDLEKEASGQIADIKENFESLGGTVSIDCYDK